MALRPFIHRFAGAAIVLALVAPATSAASESGESGGSTETSAPDSQEAIDAVLNVPLVALDAGVVMSEGGQTSAPSDGTLLATADLVVPTDASVPMTLQSGGAEIEIEIPSITGTPGSAFANMAVFEGTDPSASTVVQPVDDGVRVLTVIADDDAPSVFRFEQNLPPGAGVTEVDGGLVISGADGTVLAVVPPPWAVDAAGQPVPAHYHLDGSTIEMTVVHAGAEFPVVADPFWKIPIAVKIVSGLVQAGTKAYTGTRVVSGMAANSHRGYTSFTAFKNAFGSIPNHQWHHIVQQTTNVNRFGATAIHNTNNLINIPTVIHTRITAYQNSVHSFTNGLGFRDWVSQMPFHEQHRWGVWLLRQHGIQL